MEILLKIKMWFHLKLQGQKVVEKFKMWYYKNLIWNRWSSKINQGAQKHSKNQIQHLKLKYRLKRIKIIIVLKIEIKMTLSKVYHL